MLRFVELSSGSYTSSHSYVAAYLDSAWLCMTREGEKGKQALSV